MSLACPDHQTICPIETTKTIRLVTGFSTRMKSQSPSNPKNQPFVTRMVFSSSIPWVNWFQALTFSTRKFLAFSTPKAVPTTPHHHAEVQAQSQAAASSLQSHPYAPYYRLRSRTPTETAPSESLTPVASNTTPTYPPETQALPAFPSLDVSPPATHATIPYRPHDLPVVRVFGGGTHAEGADATSMSHSTSPVPASTIDMHPPEAQAPTYPPNTLPASPSLDGSAPVVDATTPRTPRNLPVVRVFGGGTRAEGVDSASTLPSTAMLATPSKCPCGQSRDISPRPSRMDNSRSRSPQRTHPEGLRPRSRKRGQYSFMHLATVAVLAWFCTAGPSLHEEPVPTTTFDTKTRGTEARSLETAPENQPLINLDPNLCSEMCGTEAWSLKTAPENQAPEHNLESPSNPIISNESPDVDMVDTTDFQLSSSPAITGSAGSGAEAIPPQPIPPQPLSLPLSLPLSVQLETTIQVVEPTVKLVVETIIKRMTDSAQGASGACHDLEESEADDDDDTPSKRRKKPGKRGQKNYLHDAFHKYLEEKGVKKRRGDSTLPKSAPPYSVREFNATNDHPPTLSDLMIDWSSSLMAPGWNTEVVQLLTVDFQQKLKNSTYPLVVFDEGKMNLLALRKLCIAKLRRMCREKQDGAKLATTDITSQKERHWRDEGEL
ncbi:hypothetical protein BDN67DRAFT_983381 [Paxillus ammoniavirescens]|nr:hypothetical protein BDN67DRAFT_983381 [Paxillus ammoniavirescens]